MRIGAISKSLLMLIVGGTASLGIELTREIIFK
jgi:hypothetical protein